MACAGILKLAKEAAEKAVAAWGQSMSRLTHLLFFSRSSEDMLGSHVKLANMMGLSAGYESNEEPSSCSDSGESLDGELKTFVLVELKDRETIHLSVKDLEAKSVLEVSDNKIESICDLSLGGDNMQVMHDEANSLTIPKDMYNVAYEDDLELNSEQEGGQGLVSHEECVQSVTEKSENSSVEEVMSFCDGESVCEAVVQVEGLFDDGVDDISFFDSLMLEASDNVSFSSSLDTSMLENVTCVFFDRLFDEEVPLAIIIVAPKENDACADASNVFKGVICLLARMYAFQCLLKAAFVVHDDVTGVSKSLKYNIPA
ncbi:hypothetical protein L7F22_055047 [Adiantum nelumboides]|nr:hypothetical protein [Adiantum nelumboides]